MQAQRSGLRNDGCIPATLSQGWRTIKLIVVLHVPVYHFLWVTCFLSNAFDFSFDPFCSLVGEFCCRAVSSKNSTVARINLFGMFRRAQNVSSAISWALSAGQQQFLTRKLWSLQVVLNIRLQANGWADCNVRNSHQFFWFAIVSSSAL